MNHNKNATIRAPFGENYTARFSQKMHNTYGGTPTHEGSRVLDWPRQLFEDFSGFVALMEQIATEQDLRLFQEIQTYYDDGRRNPTFEHTHFGRPYEVVAVKKYSEEVRRGVTRVYQFLNGKDDSDLDTEDGEVFDENLRTTIEFPQSNLLVARKKDEYATIIGVSVVNIMQTLGGTKAYLDDVVVDPAERGQGIVAALYDEVQDLAQKQGAEKLEFTSHESRQAAHRLYLEAGARIIGTSFFRQELS